MSRKQVEDQTLAAFFGDISVLIASGMTSEQIIVLLQTEASDGLLSQTLLSMLSVLEEGGGFGHAMAQSGRFPDYAVTMVQAGEAAGRLEEVTASLGLYYDRRAQMNRLVTQAMVQPLTLLFILTVIMGVFVGMVLPVLTGVYQAMGGDASLYTSVAYTVGGVAFAVISLALVGLFSLWVCFKTGRLPRVLDWLWQHSLPTREAALRFAQAQLMSDFETRVCGGLMPDESFAQAADGVRHRQFKASAQRCAVRLSQGEGLGEAVCAERLLPPACLYMLLSGVKGGRVEQAVSRVCGRLAEEAEAYGAAIVCRVEPMLTGFFTLAMGISLLSVLLPVIGVITAMV